MQTTPQIAECVEDLKEMKENKKKGVSKENKMASGLKRVINEKG